MTPEWGGNADGTLSLTHGRDQRSWVARSSVIETNGRTMTIETEEQYREAVGRLEALAETPDEARDEAAFLDLSAAMLAYEMRPASVPKE